MFTLLVSGSRYQKDAEIVWSPLYWMINRHKTMMVRHGACPTGVDLHAHEWIELPGQKWNTDPRSDLLVLEDPHEVTPLMWQTIGKPAGPQRNQRMVNLDADAHFSFPDSRRKSGTLDCLARAWVKGIPCYVFNFQRVGVFHVLTEGEGAAVAHRMLGYGS